MNTNSISIESPKSPLQSGASANKGNFGKYAVEKKDPTHALTQPLLQNPDTSETNNRKLGNLASVNQDHSTEERNTKTVDVANSILYDQQKTSTPIKAEDKVPKEEEVSLLGQKYNGKLEEIKNQLDSKSNEFGKAPREEIKTILKNISHILENFEKERKSLRTFLLREKEWDSVEALDNSAEKIRNDVVSLRQDAKKAEPIESIRIESKKEKHQWLIANLQNFASSKRSLQIVEHSQGHPYLFFIAQDGLAYAVRVLNEKELASKKNLLGRGVSKTFHSANCYHLIKDGSLKKSKNRAVGYQSDPISLKEGLLYQKIQQLGLPLTGIKPPGIISNQNVNVIVDKRLDNDLAAYLKNGPLMLPGKEPNEVRKGIALQFLTALTTFQKIGFIHGDLKPANILLNLETGEIAICDLDNGNFNENPARQDTQYVFNQSEFTLASNTNGAHLGKKSLDTTILAHKCRDVTSGAMVLIEIILGHSFIKELRNPDILRSAIPPVPETFIELIKGMLDPNVEQRLTAEEALARLQEIKWK